MLMYRTKSNLAGGDDRKMIMRCEMVMGIPTDGKGVLLDVFESYFFHEMLLDFCCTECNMMTMMILESSLSSAIFFPFLASYILFVCTLVFHVVLCFPHLFYERGKVTRSE